MSDKFQFYTLVLLLVATFMLAAFGAGWVLRGRQADVAVSMRPDTVLLHITDTLRLVKTQQIHDTVTNTIVQVVQVPMDAVDIDPSVDSALVSLPFEQHFVSLDSVADIWFSGYKAQIDSAVVYKHTITHVIQQPFEVSKLPRVTLDVGVGAFYHSERVNPYLLGELCYNRPKATFSAYGVINHEGAWAAGLNVSYRLNLIK